MDKQRQPLPSTAKTQISFKSNRNYFDQDKGDTMTIITKGLPIMNRLISTDGAFCREIDENSCVIKTSKHYDDLKEITLKIFFMNHPGDRSEVPVLYDSIVIPAK